MLYAFKNLYRIISDMFIKLHVYAQSSMSIWHEIFRQKITWNSEYFSSFVSFHSYLRMSDVQR